MKITLYDLVDKNGNRYSNPGWRTRMALLHKRLRADIVLCCHSDKKLAFTGQNLVPVLVHEGNIVCDSWKIACYLDDTFPDRSMLMDGTQARAIARFINHWAETKLDRLLAISLYLEIFQSLHPDADAERFRRTREQRLGATLEELRKRRPDCLKEFNDAIRPLNSTLQHQAYLAGNSPAYVDYIIYGTLQLPMQLNGLDPVANEHTAIRDWRERIDRHYDALTCQVSSDTDPRQSAQAGK